MVTGRLDWAQRATPAGDGAASDQEMRAQSAQITEDDLQATERSGARTERSATHMTWGRLT